MNVEEVYGVIVVEITEISIKISVIHVKCNLWSNHLHIFFSYLPYLRDIKICPLGQR